MRQVGGYVAVAVGTFFGVGVLLNAGGSHSSASLLLSFVLFAVAPVAAGAWLLRKPRPRAQALVAADRAWDSELLRLAARRDGHLSVAEVVAHADLDAGDAERRLDALCRRGLCEISVTETGVVVYRFQATPSAAEKAQARGVLE